MPTGVATFTLLKRFCAETLNVSPYLRLVGLPGPKPPPPGPPPRPPPPPGPRPKVPPLGPPKPAFAALSFLAPKPKDLLTRRLKLKRPGLVPKSYGTRMSPGSGAMLKQPSLVETKLVGAPGPQPVPNAGRSLKIESLLLSSPVVTLYGMPELAMTNGLRRNAYGRPMVPPRKRRLRMS